MARDKAKDDEFFNCSEPHEFTYVSGLYDDSEKVKVFLAKSCAEGNIKYSTHLEVYQLIETTLGYPVPN